MLPASSGAQRRHPSAFGTPSRSSARGYVCVSSSHRRPLSFILSIYPDLSKRLDSSTVSERNVCEPAGESRPRSSTACHRQSP
eukprot:scaffold120637_cov30-Phaeocystis_antarctica.AAC.1